MRPELRYEIVSRKVLMLFCFLIVLFAGTASAVTYPVNGTTYPMIYNGTYASQNINYMVSYSNGYDLFWNGGLLQTVWDGVYAYDTIAFPENGTAISPWTFWHVESYNPINKKWGETIPISNQFVKIDNSTLKRVMLMGSGEKFNITYHNYGTKIKQDLELTTALARIYRLTYRIDSVAAQDVSTDTKKFTPGFFNNFTLFDITDVQPFTVNSTFNETSGLWEGDGLYLYGWNTTATIDNTDRKMYFTLTNDRVMTVGQKVNIDPSWSTNGSATSAWQNTSYDDTMVSDWTDTNNNIILDWQANSSTDAWTETVTNWGAYGCAETNSLNTTDFKRKTASGQSVQPDSSCNSVLVPFTSGNYSQYDFFEFWIWMNRSANWRDTYSVYNDADNNRWSLTGEITPPGTWKRYRLYKSAISLGNFNSMGTKINFDWSGSDGPSIVKIDGMFFGKNISSGNVTHYYNSGSGNEVYQIDVNATTPTNTNYTLWYGNNASGTWTQLGGTLTGNNSEIISGTKYQNTDVQVRLAGNTTATPELIQITFYDQVAGGDTTSPTYSGASHNQTIAGLPTLFSIQYNDETALHPNGQWIFSTNNTGEWANDSAVNWTATPEWANVTKTLNSSVGTVVGYRWYANDSAGNTNNTPIYSLTVTSGGTLYERTAADSITTTEGASRTLYSFRAASDAVLVSDTADRILFSFRIVSDSIAITEGVQRIYYGVRSVSDAVIVTEYAVATFIDVGEIFTRYASDVITVVEGAARQLTYVRFISDNISVTEGTQRFLLAFRSVSDIVSVTDSAVRIAIYNRAVQQAITVSDNIQSSLSEAGELFIRYASDTITITEGAARSWWEGVIYTVSGYVHNILSSPLEDARVEYTGSDGNYSFTDATGYYSINVPAGNDRQILSRAIGYRNDTEILDISGNVQQNFTLNERTSGTVSTPGFSAISGIFIIGLTIILINNMKKRR